MIFYNGYMPKLFVEKTIEINAPASKVWDVLTSPEYISEWAPEFAGSAEFPIESDWKPSSRVLWKDQDSNVIVEGNVTAVEPNSFLRFTVFDVREEKPPVTEEDSIPYKLTEHGGKTTFRLLQGDFSVMTEGEKYHRLSEEVWDRVLPKVKALAEKDN